jgi:hypothetical protein
MPIQTEWRSAMVLLASAFDQSRFLKAPDVPVTRKFRIKNVTVENMEKDKEQKLVVWLTNDKRGLVLNKTNNRILRAAFGDDVDGWTGKIVILYSEMKNNGKLGLSVRIPPPKQPTAAIPQPQPSGIRGAATQSGNGAAAVMKPETAPPAQAVPASDPELEPDAVVPLDEELDDEIQF